MGRRQTFQTFHRQTDYSRGKQTAAKVINIWRKNFTGAKSLPKINKLLGNPHVSAIRFQPITNLLTQMAEVITFKIISPRSSESWTTLPLFFSLACTLMVCISTEQYPVRTEARCYELVLQYT